MPHPPTVYRATLYKLFYSSCLNKQTELNYIHCTKNNRILHIKTCPSWSPCNGKCLAFMSIPLCRVRNPNIYVRVQYNVQIHSRTDSDCIQTFRLFLGQCMKHNHILHMYFLPYKATLT